jgi:hypothetical protein
LLGYSQLAGNSSILVVIFDATDVIVKSPKCSACTSVVEPACLNLLASCVFLYISSNLGKSFATSSMFTPNGGCLLSCFIASFGVTVSGFDG